MSIWNSTPLKYTAVGIAMNLINGRDSLNGDSGRSESHNFLKCPKCNARSAVDCGDRIRVYCSSCHQYSNI